MVYPIFLASSNVFFDGISILVTPACRAASSIFSLRCFVRGLMQPSAMSLVGKSFFAFFIVVDTSFGWGATVCSNGVPGVGLNTIITREEGSQFSFIILSALNSPFSLP